LTAVTIRGLQRSEKEARAVERAMGSPLPLEEVVWVLLEEAMGASSAVVRQAHEC
jgi:hypothetical protein